MIYLLFRKNTCEGTRYETLLSGGIDIGSTTAKLVILDERGVLCYGDYRRHCAHTQETLAELLEDACAKLGPCDLRLKITGSGAINLGKALNIGFVQEVVAVASSLQAIAPQTDVAIELGGEDAKIIYFRGGRERMNGVCAGGTGSFIDQMAALLQTDAEGLNRAAADYREPSIPFAARCGVFAKSDIQPLINEGATVPDLAASIFQAVVNQTISGLACGKPIRGCVAFRRPAALPAGAEKGLHPHPAPDAGEYRRPREFPPLRRHGRCPGIR